MLNILLVDDEPSILLSVDEALRAEGHQVTTALDGLSAQAALTAKVFDVVISDVRLPKVDGFTLFKKVRHEAPRTSFILMTAYATVPDAVGALNLGAVDYLPKPFDLEVLLKVLDRIGHERSLSRDFVTQRLSAEADAEDALLGQSPPMEQLRGLIERYAHSDAPVSLVGERGTGKRLVAQALHRRSARRAHPFISIGCAGFPSAPWEAALLEAKAGQHPATGGTLFLTELGALPLAAQARLLSTLQQGEEPGAHPEVRVITSTVQPLQELVAAGRLLEGLAERLRVLELSVPALRARGDDLMLLLEHLLRRFAAPSSPPELSVSALAALSAYPFPGNVRELAHAIRRAVVVSGGRRVEVSHLPQEISGQPGAISEGRSLPEAVRAFEREYLKRVLQKSEGHRARAAELLGISRKNLWEKLKGYAISEAELSLPTTELDEGEER